MLSQARVQFISEDGREVIFMITFTKKKSLTALSIALSAFIDSVSKNAAYYAQETHYKNLDSFRPGVEYNSQQFLDAANAEGYSLNIYFQGDSDTGDQVQNVITALTREDAEDVSITQDSSESDYLESITIEFGQAGGYELYRAEELPINFKLLATLDNESEYAETDVEFGKTYHYKARVVDGTQKSAFSPITTITMLEGEVA